MAEECKWGQTERVLAFCSCLINGHSCYIYYRGSLWISENRDTVRLLKSPITPHFGPTFFIEKHWIPKNNCVFSFPHEQQQQACPNKQNEGRLLKVQTFASKTQTPSYMASGSVEMSNFSSVIRIRTWCDSKDPYLMDPGETAPLCYLGGGPLLSAPKPLRLLFCESLSQ